MTGNFSTSSKGFEKNLRMQIKDDKYYKFVRIELTGLLPNLHGMELDAGCGGGPGTAEQFLIPAKKTGTISDRCPVPV